ncbi:MAG: hypothetical protein LBN43_00955, partial [Oscillospiraceae bacterium]|nr:hypothetical protein [Oscillospiraceae bacterium]
MIIVKSDHGVIFEKKPGVFFGGVGTAEKLHGDFKQGCLQNVNRAFGLGQQCPIATATRVVQAIDNSVLIVHSPIGCTGVMNMENGSMKIHSRLYGLPERNSWIMTTNMDEMDIINGGEAKLKETILEAVRRHDPELISIMTSCASGIIGDDIDSVIEQLQPELRAILLPIYCEGFRSRIPMTGSDSAFLGIQRTILKDAEPAAEKQDLVNVVVLPTTGPKDRGYLGELLGRMGLKANFVPYFGSVASLKNMVNAKVSTSVCVAYGSELLEFLKNKYDVPFTKYIMPIGSLETDEWLREIGRYTGKEKEAEQVIAEERATYLDRIKALRTRVEGRRVLICNNLMRGLANAAIARDLGLDIEAIQSIVYTEFMNNEYAGSRLSEVIKPDTKISFNGMQPHEFVNLARKVKIDLYLGMGGEN